MNCVVCGDGVLVTRENACIEGEYRGEKYSVEMPADVRSRCGFVEPEARQTPELMRRLADAHRSKRGLLTSDEIRGARNRLGMSQAAFAKYLGAGVASVKRWEMGKVQDPAMDALIHLKCDVSAAQENLRYLESRVAETEDPTSSPHAA